MKYLSLIFLFVAIRSFVVICIWWKNINVKSNIHSLSVPLLWQSTVKQLFIIYKYYLVIFT